MGKEAISVTLEADNLTWLRGRARAATRSVSETLDRLIANARKSGSAGETRSVVGTLSIASEDPDLATADVAVRALLARSLRRRPGADPRGVPRQLGRKSRG